MSTAKSKWDSEDEEDSRARPERSQKRRKQTGKGTGTSIHMSHEPSDLAPQNGSNTAQEPQQHSQDLRSRLLAKRSRSNSREPTLVNSVQPLPSSDERVVVPPTSSQLQSHPPKSASTTPNIPREDQPDQIQQAPPVPPIPINPPRRRLVGPPLVSCRCVDTFEKLNRIEEGAYGVVYRARDRETGEIVALKRLKLEKEVNGFPVTSLREIHTLLLAKHPNIVNVKEIVVTPSMRGVFIVMEFVEHDLKSLMESMPSPFLQSEIKTLMIQLLSAVALLHQNWIIHRDLKTSNLLMNNQGQIKVADFGLARRFGSPLGPVTQLVVTLWYRAPELLLGAKEYTTAIDMWSIGCIFGELVNKEPLLQGRGEIDQLKKIFQLLGTPNERIWPSMKSLPGCKTFSFVNQPYNNLRSRFSYLTENGLDLMSKLLTYDPEKRISAEDALRHPYFSEQPLPKDPSMFPTFPSKGAGEKRKVYASPSAPKASHGDGGRSNDGDDTGHPGLFDAVSAETSGAGFRLKV